MVDFKFTLTLEEVRKILIDKIVKRYHSDFDGFSSNFLIMDGEEELDFENFTFIISITPGKEALER